MHLAVITSPIGEGDDARWLVFCETCKGWSEPLANEWLAMGFQSRHQKDPESDPVVSLVPEVTGTDR